MPKQRMSQKKGGKKTMRMRGGCRMKVVLGKKSTEVGEKTFRDSAAREEGKSVLRESPVCLVMSLCRIYEL